VRLGLASALLFDGIFQCRAHSGDSQNWKHWFDEYAVDPDGKATSSAAGLHWLGKSLAPAQQRLRKLDSPNLLANAQWRLVIEKPALAAADLQERDAVRTVSITRTGVGAPSLVALRASSDAPLEPGTEYTFSFEARASTPRLVDLSFLTAEGSANAAKIFVPLYVRADWKRTVITCLCQSRRVLRHWELALELGRDTGDVEFRNVSWQKGTGEIGWTREFENGMAVVNPTRRPQSFADIGAFRKLLGRQDPKHNDGAPVKAPLLVPPSDAFLLQRISATP
nr:hypothetical protein [Verrucomicrobiota bacterium]